MIWYIARIKAEEEAKKAAEQAARLAEHQKQEVIRIAKQQLEEAKKQAQMATKALQNYMQEYQRKHSHTTSNCCFPCSRRTNKRKLSSKLSKGSLPRFFSNSMLC